MEERAQPSGFADMAIREGYTTKNDLAKIAMGVEGLCGGQRRVVRTIARGNSLLEAIGMN